MKRTLRVFLVLLLCSNWLAVLRGAENRPSETALAAEVEFLASPRLKGRAPRSYGSHLARDFIQARFSKYGLVPWGKEKSFELSFGYGRNVVGILPGSDPNLASEIVLLSAHFDHLGKHKGKVYYGAADNASGVAALLEAARILSTEKHKRTIAFAAFDCEEQNLLGSFAFSCRPDVVNANIIGVLNADMLGRDFLDAVHNTLFVSGMEHFPSLRQQVFDFGTNFNIRILPLGSDLIGPRSDHAAFENRAIPCLFFSCGTCKDYHEPGDTPDKLDYAAIARSAQVIVETARFLSETEKVEQPQPGSIDANELITVETVLSEARDNAGAGSMREADLQKLEKLQKTARELLQSGQYDRAAREHLAVTAAGTLAPYLMPGSQWGDESSPEQKQEGLFAMQFLQLLYLNYHSEMLSGYKKLVEHVLKYKPGLFHGMPNFDYEIYDIPPRNICLKQCGSDEWSLSVLVNEFSLSAYTSSKWFIKTFGMYISIGTSALDYKGSLQEIEDALLLRLHSEQTNEVHFHALQSALREVTGTPFSGTYKEVLASRLARGGYKSAKDWIVQCISSPNPDLALEAIEAAGFEKNPKVQSALQSVALNRGMRADVRAAAIKKIRLQAKEIFLSLCDLLDDNSLTARTDPRLRPDYPFAEQEVMKIVHPIMEYHRQASVDSTKTIADIARERLRAASGRDFLYDAPRWRRCIERHFAKR